MWTSRSGTPKLRATAAAERAAPSASADRSSGAITRPTLNLGNASVSSTIGSPLAGTARTGAGAWRSTLCVTDPKNIFR